MANQGKLVADLKNKQLATWNIEKQLSQLASSQNTLCQGGLRIDTDPNSKQVNAISTYSGKQLVELAPQKEVLQGVTDDQEKVQPNKESKVDNVVKSFKPPPLFRQKFNKKTEDECFGKFINLLKQVDINLPLVDVFQGISKYATYVKDIMANKNILTEYATIALTKSVVL